MTTIGGLIVTRLEALGMSEADLMAGLGFRHIDKWRAFIEGLHADQTKSAFLLRRRIAELLEVPVGEVEAASEASDNAQQERFNAAYRASFVPHAILMTAYLIPTPIVAAAVTGSAERLREDLPRDMETVEWPRWVVRQLPEGLPGFGPV